MSPIIYSIIIMGRFGVDSICPTLLPGDDYEDGFQIEVMEPTSGGVSIAVVHHGPPSDRKRRRLAATDRTKTRDLKLAPTTTNKIDLHAMEADYPELGPVFKTFRDGPTFMSLFLRPEDPATDARRSRRPLSRGMMQHAAALKKHDVMEDVDERTLDQGWANIQL
jgi:hypothetical protein